MLERAQQVYDLYLLLATTGERPGQRVSELAVRLGMRVHRVRRYLALAVAPEPIKEYLRAGKLSMRAVVMMQGLTGVQQRSLARKIIDSQIGSKAAQATILDVTERVQTHKTFSEEACHVERSLLEVAETLETLIDLPSRTLEEVYQAAGGSVGRRTLETLVEQIIDHGQILKQALEHIGAIKEGVDA